jgi:anti-sigma-K factor RskA
MSDRTVQISDADPIGHDAVRELLALAALDGLSPDERRALEVHLTTCDECRRELAALRDGMASIAGSLPPRAMAPERQAAMRARLMSRALDDRERVDRARVAPLRTPSSDAPTSYASARPSSTRWLAAAALVIAAAAVAYGLGQRGAVTQLASHVAALRDSASIMQHRLADKQSALDALTGPGVRVIDASASSGRQPYARMFWDQPDNRWTFVAYNLPAAAPGHTYQLWLVTRDQRKVNAGTFEPQSNGSAIVRATYALAPDSLAAIAVTNEPAGGSPQPTTTPLLVGAAAKSD